MTKRYTYKGPEGTTRHGGRLLLPGDEVVADESLDHHPFFMPAGTEPEEAEPEADQMEEVNDGDQ